MPDESKTSRSRSNWILAWVLSAIPLLGFWLTGLFDLDEGFYAAVSGEMLRRGDYITPYYNGFPWFEKPILLYWFAAPSIAVFGEAVGPRLPSVLAALALYALVGWFVKREVSETAGQVAMVATATMLLVVLLARLMMTDMLLLLSLSAALFLFYLSVKENPNWRYLSFIALGFSVHAKGPIGIGLMVIIAALLYWRAPSLRQGFKGVWLLPSVLLVAVVAIWYLPAYIQNGDVFVQQFLIEQNIGRFLGGDEAHTLPFFPGVLFYIPIALVGFAPWIFVTLSSLRKKNRQPADPFQTFCWIWAGVVFVVFTLSAAKLPHYILLMAPPIAIIAALRLTRTESDSWSRGTKTTAVVTSLVLVFLANFGQSLWYSQTHAGLHELVRSVRHEDASFSSYAMTKPEFETAQIGTSLQDTEHPSLLFYLNKTALLTSTFDEVLELETPIYVFTRTGRIGTEHKQKAQQEGVALEKLKETPDGFELYRITASSER